jgi:hypothetical protein
VSTTQPDFDFYAKEPAEVPASKPVLKRGIASALGHRKNKKQVIEEFFTAHFGVKFSTHELHEKFGTAFRTRASDINRDETSLITIRNEHSWNELAQAEISNYWSELKEPHS